MKKIISILALLVLAIGIVGCSSSNTVSPADIDKKIENKESFIVIASSDTCSACKTYKPIVEEFTKKVEDASLVEVVIDKAQEDEDLGNFVLKYSITATPTTLFFKDGKLKTMVARVLTEGELENMYNQYVK